MKMHLIPITNTPASTRRIQFEGRDTIVAPVILMVEGVHNGSAGPLFYPREELRACAQLWNGMPIPVFHPSDETGLPISCNSPDVIASHNVGRLYNVMFEESPVPRLRGEIYLDVQKTQQVNPPVRDALSRNVPLEVSTGLFSQDEMIQGTWNNETYNGIVRGIRPDHLALLPGTRGACSWQDGCGVRANKEGGGKVDKLEMTVNELSLDDRRTAVVRSIYSMDGPTQDNMVVAVFNDKVVYETRPGPQSNSGMSTKMYERGYAINDQGVVTLSDEITEVKREVNYVPVTNEEAGNIKSNNKEEEKMAEKIVVSEERKQKVAVLIANGAFTEEDRTFLENCECPQFSRMEALANRPAKANEAKQPTFQEVLDANPEFKANHDFIQAKIKEHRADLTTRIKANENNKFTDEQLNGMDIKMLETVANTFVPVVNYQGAGGGHFQVNADEAKEEPLVMPILNEVKEAKKEE